MAQAEISEPRQLHVLAVNQGRADLFEKELDEFLRLPLVQPQLVKQTFRQIRSLLYEQGFTIGGARNRLQGDEARDDLTQAQQIVRQIRVELEEVLRILRR